MEFIEQTQTRYRYCQNRYWHIEQTHTYRTDTDSEQILSEQILAVALLTSSFCLVLQSGLILARLLGRTAILPNIYEGSAAQQPFAFRDVFNVSEVSKFSKVFAEDSYWNQQAPLSCYAACIRQFHSYLGKLVISSHFFWNWFGAHAIQVRFSYACRLLS